MNGDIGLMGQKGYRGDIGVQGHRGTPGIPVIFILKLQPFYSIFKYVFVNCAVITSQLMRRILKL